MNNPASHWGKFIISLSIINRCWYFGLGGLRRNPYRSWLLEITWTWGIPPVPTLTNWEEAAPERPWQMEDTSGGSGVATGGVAAFAKSISGVLIWTIPLNRGPRAEEAVIRLSGRQITLSSEINTASQTVLSISTNAAAFQQNN